MKELFKQLFEEYLNFLIEKKYISSIFIFHYDNIPIADFQILRLNNPNIDNEIKENLPSYKLFFETLSKIKEKTSEETEKELYYKIFNYEFSKLLNYLYNPFQIYKLSQKRKLESLEINEELLEKQGLSWSNLEEESKKHLIIFEGLEIEENFEISEDIKFIKLDKKIINEKIKSPFEANANWTRVKTGIEINGDFEENFIIKLSTLLRIFKKADIRYKFTYKEVDHYFKGKCYVRCKNSSTEKDYVEHKPINEAWRKYLLKKSEIEQFKKFTSENIEKLEKLIYSCRIYNTIPSIDLKLRVPILFFIFESFFSDVDSEVTFRISLYVTKLLEKDKDFFKNMKSLYRIRSKIAHGDFKEADKQMNKLFPNFISSKGFKPLAEKIEGLLDELFFKLLEIEWNPKKSGEEIRQYLI